MRLMQVSDEHWRRLTAVRRAYDLDGVVARSEIGAIEIELRALQDDTRVSPVRQSAAR